MMSAPGLRLAKSIASLIEPVPSFDVEVTVYVVCEFNIWKQNTEVNTTNKKWFFIIQVYLIV